LRDLEFDITITDSNVSGSSTGEYIPSNNGLLTILEYDDTTSDQLCFEYSSITTYIGIEYEAILGDCVDLLGDDDGVVVLPQKISLEVLDIATKRIEIEEVVKNELQKNPTSPGKYYPFNDKTLELYNQKKKNKKKSSNL